jgi:DNA-binding transcriptional LysR family regulator
MNIILARTFLELVHTRNFNKAADRLCVTQSTVTVRIGALEDQLGQQLFVRDKTGVSLTVAGRKFQPFAELLLQTWQHARQQLALSDRQSAMFSVGIDDALWVGIGRPWLAAITRTQPSIALHVDLDPPAQTVERLTRGFLDAALLYEPTPRPELVIEELASEEYFLVSTYPRAAERWNPDYVLIQWGNDFQNQHQAIMPVDITPPVTFTGGGQALDFILERGGSAYFPLRHVQRLLDDGRLYYVENANAMTRRIHFAFTKSVRDNEWFEDVRNLLIAQVSAVLNGEARS